MDKLMARCFLSMVLLLSNTYALSWQSLWRTPNQQAMQALQEKAPQKAAKLFENQAWRGVAHYREGDYKAASKDFANDKTAKGYYNLGNSLARLHQYQKAINAYTQAIALEGDFKEAQENRELVKKLMQEKKSQQNQSAQNSKNQSSQKNSSTSADSRNNQARQDQPGEQNKKQQSEQNASQSKNQKNKTDQAKKDQSDQESKQQTKGKQNQQSAKKNQSVQSAENSSEPHEKNQSQSRSQKINPEQQANQQWLNQIPDDPGGLLRQKFLRDHRRYQATNIEG